MIALYFYRIVSRSRHGSISWLLFLAFVTQHAFNLRLSCIPPCRGHGIPLQNDVRQHVLIAKSSFRFDSCCYTRGGRKWEIRGSGSLFFILFSHFLLKKRCGLVIHRSSSREITSWKRRDNCHLITFNRFY